MSDLAQQIPDNFEALKALYLAECMQTKSLRLAMNQKDFEIKYLEQLLRLAKHKQFGRSSEKYAGMQCLFDEAEQSQEDDESSQDDQADEDQPKKKKKRGSPKRAPLPENLPRKDVIIELCESERRCAAGHLLTEIGEEVSEHLEIEPAKFTVIRTIRKKYGRCPCQDCIRTAPAPARAIPKSIAGASLLAFVIVSKYLDGLPLYRLSGMLTRGGVQISRGLMATWMIRCSNLLTPLYNLLNDELLESSYIHCDETRVQVLKEDGKTATSQSYMWVRCRSGPEYPIILYEYDPTRSGDVPMRLLQGFSGYLQVDGYSGYDKLCKSDEIIRVGCWAHGRRKFDEAIKGHKKPKKARVAKQALDFMARLKRIEDECKDKSYDEILKIRQAQSQPILDEMRFWLDTAMDQTAPKTLTGKALTYLDNQWHTLVVYATDGRLKMDNNFAENAIRPFVMGRKAWLFSATPGGAKASAILYSLMITAKANGLDVFKYMQHVLTNIPLAKSVADYEALLPHRYQQSIVQ